MITRQAIADAINLAVGRWRWRKADSLARLAELRTQHLIRMANKDTSDPARTAMFNALIALGHAGVVVHDWRPGTFSRIDAATLETIASVAFFADSDTKDAIENVLYHAGKVPGARKYSFVNIFEPYGPGCEEYDTAQRHFDGQDMRNDGGAWVERIDGQNTARIGGQMTPAEIYRAFPVRASLAELMSRAGDADKVTERAWLITMVAPVWGHSRMWEDLLTLLPQVDQHRRRVRA
jgi:hypothetical protein